MQPRIVGDFELHLTLHGDPEQARAYCAARGLGFIHIELDRGATRSQPMVTVDFHGELPGALAAAQALSGELAEAGFVVTRVKIEASPSATGLPQCDADAELCPASNYWEHHVKLLLPVSGPAPELMCVCANHGAHLSRNSSDQPRDAMQARFVTMRVYGAGWISAREKFDAIDAALAQLGLTVLKTESEYCVYDSRVELDAGWLIAEGICSVES